MGYNKQNYTFCPDDTEEKIHIVASHTMQELIEKCAEKWPGIALKDLHVSAENIQTSSIGYDLPNSSDYTDFIIIERA